MKFLALAVALCLLAGTAVACPIPGVAVQAAPMTYAAPMLQLQAAPVYAPQVFAAPAVQLATPAYAPVIRQQAVIQQRAVYSAPAVLSAPAVGIAGKSVVRQRSVSIQRIR